MKTGQEMGTAHALMAGSSLKYPFLLSYIHCFPSLATHSLGLAKLVSKRLDIESLSRRCLVQQAFSASETLHLQEDLLAGNSDGGAEVIGGSFFSKDQLGMSLVSDVGAFVLHTPS
jgi:hypothetical protein